MGVKRKYELNKYLFLALILLIGLFLRLYKYKSYPFGFDQIQILVNAKEILLGNLTLIGPRTGYAQMFTGPLIYYLQSIILIFFRTEYSLVCLSLIISAVTGIVLYFLSRKYISDKIANTVLLIWAISPYIIFLDRITWNPNLSILATTLSFLPLFSKKIEYKDLGLIFLGAFLGFQAHFSGFLLPVLVIIIAILTKTRKQFITISIATVLGIVISTLPLLVFDFRNNWINVNGFLNFIKGNNMYGFMHLVDNQIHSFRISVENLGKLFSYHSHYIIALFLGMFLLVVGAIEYVRKKDEGLRISLLWIFLFSLFLGFYSGPKPEYYYLIQVPAMFVVVAKIISNLGKKSQKIVYVFLILYSLVLNLEVYKNQYNLGIGSQKSVSNYIYQLSERTPIKKISYDIERGDELGLKYLLNDISLSQDGVHLHITPNSVSYDSNRVIDGISVWIDPRNERGSVTESEYMILFPKEVEIFKSYEPTYDFGSSFSYLLHRNGKLVGEIFVVNEKDGLEKFEEMMVECNKDDNCSDKCGRNPLCTPKWIPFQTKDFNGYIFNKRRMIFFYNTPHNTTEENSFLNQNIIIY